MGTDGLSLADPGSNGMPRPHRGNYSLYVVADQLLWRESPQSEEGVGIFFRAMGAPSDRNLVDFSLNAGLTWREPFEHRDNDIAGLGVGYAHVSSNAASLDNATQFYSGTYTPSRSSETFIEATYQYSIVPWWQIQPDFQYVFNPGGGLANPNDPTERIKNEAVFGIRTNVTF
jgi:porin